MFLGTVYLKTNTLINKLQVMNLLTPIASASEDYLNINKEVTADVTEHHP